MQFSTKIKLIFLVQYVFRLRDVLTIDYKSEYLENDSKVPSNQNYKDYSKWRLIRIKSVCRKLITGIYKNVDKSDSALIFHSGENSPFFQVIYEFLLAYS